MNSSSSLILSLFPDFLENSSIKLIIFSWIIGAACRLFADIWTLLKTKLLLNSKTLSKLKSKWLISLKISSHWEYIAALASSTKILASSPREAISS